ncbi:DNA gyrase subunit A [bacterium]|nr:DNA gyrase subunit A [bacterium]MBT3850658.1 DNA gyrase subunit A [bacterium]MBT4435421.1 DNA gyrase subunit A [bacterium]
MSQDKNIKQTEIYDELKDSYLSYSLSVIIGRALPDVRDGLKPVHRRLLYGMKDLSLEHNKSYKKSARVVGDVMGKFHPHGDSALYEALVRMAQDFSLRYPLVDGQGNFGSIDGDSAAAMRYTEVKLTKLSSQILEDLEKDTVDFIENYDGSSKEPKVLPSKIPNLLLNGASGIAVGMSTNIPPHNCKELISTIVEQIKNPKITIDEIIKIMPGPDFPTGGIIHGSKEIIRQAYETGKGIIKLRGVASVEPETDRIVITEIPYQVNKSKLIEKIASLVREEKIRGISDIRDESNRDGIRVVIDPKRGEDPNVILNNIFSLTSLSTSFGIILLAIDDGKPKLLGIKEINQCFINHRFEIITKRFLFELKKSEERLHLLDGFKIALDNLDKTIKIIRKSKEPNDAKLSLIKELKISEIQSLAILDLRLQRLTGMEQSKILDERDALIKRIKDIKKILSSAKEINKIMIGELEEISEQYGDTRKSKIDDRDLSSISIEDLISEEDMVVTLTHEGFIKRTPLDLYRSQRRGGVGKKGATSKNDDFAETVFVASTHDYVVFFTNKGNCFWRKVYELPEASLIARGRGLSNVLNLSNDETVKAFVSIRTFDQDKFLIMTTKNGIIKKSKLEDYSRPRTNGIIAINLKGDDELISVQTSSGKDEILISTRMAQAVRFNEEKVRSVGRNSMGVKGITLKPKDSVVSSEVIKNDNVKILTVTENGFGKRTDISKYRLTSRGGKGVTTLKVTEKTGEIVNAFQTENEDQIILLSSAGKATRLKASDISLIGRATQGVKLMKVDDETKVVAVAKIAEKENE